MAELTQVEGKKTALTEKARETESEAQEITRFLLMSEGGELGHAEIVGAMNEQAGDARIRELVEWARPIQERHFQDARASLKLAMAEDALAAS
jgi:hypothetical protein